MHKAAELSRAGHELIAYEAALLIEAGQADAFRPLVVVIADEAVQLERLVARDGMSIEQARARITAQLPVRQKAMSADHVIDTSGTLDDVRARTSQVVAAIGQLARSRSRL